MGSGASGIAMVLASVFIGLGGGLWWGFNEPSAISCQSQKTLCYQLRWNKKAVVLPAQEKQILENYKRSLNQQRRRR